MLFIAYTTVFLVGLGIFSFSPLLAIFLFGFIFIYFNTLEG